jgi:hypothetical protein
LHFPPTRIIFRPPKHTPYESYALHCRCGVVCCTDGRSQHRPGIHPFNPKRNFLLFTGTRYGFGHLYRFKKLQSLQEL